MTLPELSAAAAKAWVADTSAALPDAENPDALAWAKAFCSTFPNSGADEGLMLAWFANAMMAMHDHLLNTRAEASSAEPVAWIFNHRTDNEVFMSLNKARMDPRYWTETPFYSHPPAADRAGYERGQRETVARIVAWLRDGGQLRDFNGLIRKAIEAGEWK